MGRSKDKPSRSKLIDLLNKGGGKDKVARQLNISRPTLDKWIEDYGIIIKWK